MTKGLFRTALALALVATGLSAQDGKRDQVSSGRRTQRAAAANETRPLVPGPTAAMTDAGEAGPRRGLEEIVFAVRQPGVGGHWYENFGYYAQDEHAKVYRAMGRLCRLDLRTGKLTVLLDDPKGSVRDPQVHYDGRKILFSYRQGGTDYFHLYEINSRRRPVCGS